MSDWKSRATVVDDTAPKAASWKDRATPVIEEPTVAKKGTLDKLGELISTGTSDAADSGEGILRRIMEMGSVGANTALGGLPTAIAGGAKAAGDLAQRVGHKVAPEYVEKSPNQPANDDSLLAGLSDTYKAGRDRQQSVIDKQSEDLGWLGSGAANLAGLAGQTVLGTGLLKALPGGAAAAEAVAPYLSKLSSGKGLAGVAGKAAVSAIEGAPVGALGGVANSKGSMFGSPEDRQKLIEDAIDGTVTGSVVGAGLTGLAGVSKLAASKLENTIGNTNVGARLKKAYEFGSKEGKSLMDKNAKDAVTRDTDYATQLEKQILAGKTQLGKNVGSSIDKATANGVQITNSEGLASLGDQLVNAANYNPAIREEAGVIADVLKQNRYMTPDEARTNIKKIQDLADTLGDTTADNKLKGILNQYGKTLDGSLKQAVPEYADASKRYAQFMQLVPETMINGSTPSEFSNFRFGEANDPEKKLFTAAKQTINGASAPGLSEGFNKYVALKKGLKQLGDNETGMINSGKLQPADSVFKTMGSADSLLSQIADQSNEVNMLKKGFGDVDRSPHGSNFLSQIAGMSEGATLKVANKLGQMSHPKPSSVWGATEDQLRSVAQKLRSNNSIGGAHMADTLESAIQNKNQTAKNAAIFSIMQTPSARINLLSDEEK